MSNSLRKALIEARWSICLSAVGGVMAIAWDTPALIVWASGLTAGMCITEVVLRMIQHE